MLKLLREHKCQFILALFLIILECAYYSSIAITIGFVMESIEEKNIHKLGIMLGGLVAGLCIITIVTIYRYHLFSSIISKIMGELKEKLFNKLSELSMSYYAQTPTGHTLSYFTNHINLIESTLSNLGSSIIFPALMLIINIIIICAYKFLLIFIAIPSIAIIFFAQILIAKRLEPKNMKKFAFDKDIASKVNENIVMQNVIRALNISGFLKKIFFNINKKSIKISKDVYFHNGLITACSDIIPIMLLLAFLSISIYLTITEGMPISLMISFQLMFSNVVYSVVRISYNVPWLISGTLALKAINTFLSRHAEDTSNKQDNNNLSTHDAPITTKLKSNLAVEFHDVDFGYKKGHGNINNISFTIPKNSCVAFVGSSGAGKSTVLNLILGLYQPLKGYIKIDSVNTKKTSKNSLYSLMGVVFQEPILFNESILQNIKLGNLEASNEMIIKAAKAAEIHDSIIAMPGGYETIVGEAGKNLSGGQRQRIAIARALVKDPEILVFDEITSALDPKSQVAINKIVTKLSKNHTTIIVTHHLESIINVDKIYMMDKGEIVEEGAHQELLAINGAYAKLWHIQKSSKL